MDLPRRGVTAYNGETNELLSIAVSVLLSALIVSIWKRLFLSFVPSLFRKGKAAFKGMWNCGIRKMESFRIDSDGFLFDNWRNRTVKIIDTFLSLSLFLYSSHRCVARRVYRRWDRYFIVTVVGNRVNAVPPIPRDLLFSLLFFFLTSSILFSLLFWKVISKVKSCDSRIECLVECLLVANFSCEWKKRWNILSNIV